MQWVPVCSWLWVAAEERATTFKREGLYVICVHAYVTLLQNRERKKGKRATQTGVLQTHEFVKLRTRPLLLCLEKFLFPRRNWNDLLWICEVKASTENKFWLLLPGLRLIPLIHWHDLTGSGVKSLLGWCNVPLLLICHLPSHPQRLPAPPPTTRQ